MWNRNLSHRQTAKAQVSLHICTASSQPLPLAQTMYRTTVSFTHMSSLTTKPTKWHVRPAKTQTSLGICQVWSESSLSAWRKLGSLSTHWAHSKDSDQTGWMPRLIWVFAGCTVILLVLSRSGLGHFSCGTTHLFEPRHKKTCLGGLRPGKTQTSLLSYSIKISELASKGIILARQRKQRCWSDCADVQPDLRLVVRILQKQVFSWRGSFNHGNSPDMGCFVC